MMFIQFGQDGGNDYWRGVGTYEIALPNPTEGKNNTSNLKVLTTLLQYIVTAVN